MAEAIGRWWQRRRFSRGADVPYAVGTYREAWASYPVLVRQYRPEYNEGIVLSQIPPAADVYLCWLCDAGHVFVATPEEQRHRPGRERRRSSWCPDCAELASPRLPRAAPMIGGRLAEMLAPTAAPDDDSFVLLAPPAVIARGLPTSVSPTGRGSASPADPSGSARAASSTPPSARSTPPAAAARAALPPAPRTAASAVEARLRALLAERLVFDPAHTAVRLKRPFFEHCEAWPDLVLGELRVAIEYDSTGRHGLEHVGHREEADRRKDRALRSAGWEVVRIRTGKLLPLGPHDLVATGVTAALADRLVDRLRDVRGPLLVDAWGR
ncbi:hypothetical protein [Rathayibacter sp. AY1F8]|uniref:hypothetical protein n=1 Tax=Rathayibacter sp. AY1F8 TaxID=2080562 RepID=UPI000CE91B91|nr:hypothetical protein [Rathayibacter sp. AY1F8]PPH15611.1 hypothetical protein C5C35_12945 [Rathayibacter sp. AY1F8]